LRAISGGGAQLTEFCQGCLDPTSLNLAMA